MAEKYPEHLRNRIANAMAGNKIKKFNHLKKSHGVLEELFCKVCGTTIGSLIVSDRFRESKVINGKIVIFERLVFAQTPMYKDVTLEMDNGSAHATHLCKGCAEKPLDEDTLEAIYAADLQEWLNEGVSEIPEAFLRCKPVRMTVG